jgi:hypothetical protein
VSQVILFEFCLRLAVGLSCIVIFTLGRGIGLQFFRTVMLVVLGLSVLGSLNGPGWRSMPAVLLALCSIWSFFGFVFWTLGRVRLAAGAAILLFFSTVACFIFWTYHQSNSSTGMALAMGNGLSSALLLGSMVAAMLLGHTYLIAPTMSIEPLRLLVWWVAGSTLGRSMIVCASLIRTQGRVDAGPAPESPQQFWWWMVAARALIGVVGPAIIAWMVWQTARIRSTQSATGILYAGVILVFFGELLGQLLGI